MPAANAPKFKVGQKGLVAQWGGKMYPIEITTHWPYDGTEHSYEVKWTGFANTAKSGQLPTNESTYLERWIKTEGTSPTRIRASKKGASPKGTGLATRAKKAVATTKSTRAKAVAAIRQSGAAAANDLASSSVASRRQSIASPAVRTFEIRIGQQTFTKEHKWQYFDSTKPNGPWFDYDFGSSDTVEEAYEDWRRNPEVDVRSVKSGKWEYMLDFNMMDQQNIQHTAHTKRKIRRVKVSDNSDAMEESKAIQSRMALQRKASQSKQNENETHQTLARTASTHEAPKAAAAKPRGEWKEPASLSELASGQRVKVMKPPNTEYGRKFYPAEFLGEEGMISTIYGSPPVLIHFSPGTTPVKSYWFFWQDLLVPNVPTGRQAALAAASASAQAASSADAGSATASDAAASAAAA